MVARLIVFLLCVGGGGAVGWLADAQPGLATGVAAGAVAWIVIDTSQALRTLRWLRAPDARAVPRLVGLWAEAADRVRRALVAREKHARDAELRLEDFLDALRSSPNGVVLLDAEGRIEWCNQTASAHLGLDPERDLQQHIVHLLRDPEFTAFFHGRNRSQDVVVPAPGSTPSRPMKLSLRLHSYGEGRLLLLTRDVTSVEQAEFMRRDFVANVSHEIRTPLTVLAGFVETLQSLDLPREERARYLQMMAQQAQRMQTLVSDLLTLSRLEGSPPPGAGEWTPAATFIAQCEQETRALAAALGKKLELRIVAPVPLAFAGAASELQSAFSNLVSNAVRYTPTGGSLEVRLREEGGRAEWSVRDSGPGIGPEHLPRLTERFYRVDVTQSRAEGGTGLGLALVKHILNRHRGKLSIESEAGQGATFTIRLPLIHSPSPARS